MIISKKTFSVFDEDDLQLDRGEILYRLKRRLQCEGYTLFDEVLIGQNTGFRGLIKSTCTDNTDYDPRFGINLSDGKYTSSQFVGIRGRFTPKSYRLCFNIDLHN